jgi:hypothetical protein
MSSGFSGGFVAFPTNVEYDEEGNVTKELDDPDLLQVAVISYLIFHRLIFVHSSESRAMAAYTGNIGWGYSKYATDINAIHWRSVNFRYRLILDLRYECGC